MSTRKLQTHRLNRPGCHLKTIAFAIVLIASSLTTVGQNAGKKIVYKTDTTELIPANFKLKTKVSVMEMLRHADGFEIAKNGNITFEETDITTFNLNEKSQPVAQLQKTLKKLTIADIAKIWVIDDYSDAAANSFKMLPPKHVLEIFTKNYYPTAISGVVYNEDMGKAIPGAQVTELGRQNTVYTDAAGDFKINVAARNAKLVFNHVDFYADTVLISYGSKLFVSLKKKPAQVVDRADTVLYRAADYKVKNDGNVTNALTGRVVGVQVNELLKKMEGYEVASDGSVAHQGQTVTKVRFNDRDYVGGNIQQAIQSLPADIVEKIQVIDDYGDQAGMTGIKSGDPAKILNFTTKNQLKEVIIAERVDNTETYDRIVENKFINPKAEPLSTFSADIDAASYTNVRRFINSGQLPPKNAVRIEEMINYFNYNLPGPKDGKPVAITTELSTAPWNAQHQLIRIGLKGKDVEKSKLPPSNLVFLIDVSGSMFEPNKLPLVKASLKMLVDQLREKDHVAIVVYAGNAGLVLPSTAGSDKQKIKEAIDQLEAGGSTAGGAGIKLAYKIARQNFIKGGNNRVILSTDGDFNVGASSDKDMEQLIEEERGDGISISILGFGMGNYKDSKMEKIADKGHGNYACIDNITEATKSMVTEFGGTLFTVAKDVKLQVEFNPAKVAAYRLLGYEDRLLAKEDFNNDAKLGGDMGVGHTVTALYEVIPFGVKDSFSYTVDPLKYQPTETKPAKNASDEIATVKFRYKEPDGEVSKLESVVIADKPEASGKTSNDFKFAAAVAEYGLLLRNSQYKQNANFDHLISMAKAAKGEDENGYRAEFIRIAESTKNLMKSKQVVVADKSK
jgi:Ca-activated chloride channel family protein